VSRWDQQFFASTRGQIVNLLRRTRQSVDDLAAALGLTDNAVRAQLIRLERDGLVQQHGLRRGERRPSQMYELTADAEALFPKAYAPALKSLLEVLAERGSAADVQAIVREAGRRLADGRQVREGDVHQRLAAAAEVLTELGGLTEVTAGDQGALELRGVACPLGGLVSGHPELCALAEALVAEITGLPVTETCARSAGEPPRCRFLVQQPEPPS
jgi:predicted ArsR family transcriptional regulator